MPFPTPACDDSYTEHTAMAVNGPFLRQHIAPPHHDVIIDGDELRMTIGNIIQDEGADFFQRWRFEHREILSLASDLIKRPPEAFDMFDFNRHNLSSSWRIRARSRPSTSRRSRLSSPSPSAPCSTRWESRRAMCPS